MKQRKFLLNKQIYIICWSIEYQCITLIQATYQVNSFTVAIKMHNIYIIDEAYHKSCIYKYLIYIDIEIYHFNTKHYNLQMHFQSPT